MAATAAKYGAKAAAQNTSIDSKIAIMERVLDRDDATGQDILKYEQRMSAIENLLDGNLSEVYTGWMEAVDETTATVIKGDFRRILNECNDRL